MSFAVWRKVPGLVVLLVLFWGGLASRAGAEALVPGGRPGQHGMVLFGEGGALYLSHIPMFRRPHDYQAVFAVAAKSGALPADIGSRLYTFLPDACSLDDLLRGGQRSLRGQLYQGSFERPDARLLGPARFAITRVLLSRQLSAQLAAQPALSYFAFPAGQRVFLVHAIGPAPSFDQLVSVLWKGALPQPAERVALTGRADTLAQRLSPSAAVAQLSNVAVLETLLGPDFTDPPGDGQP